ncbi:MAG: class I SAM-dependent methyltransferase [Litorimonas sp.]
MSTSVTSSEELSELYKIRFQQEELPRKNAIWKILCDSFFSKYISKSDNLLDIACGYGEFLNNIDAKTKTTVDLNTDAPQFLDEDINFNLLSATSLSELGEDLFDVAFTSNFLEHLPDKTALDTLLDELKVVLKPQGRFVILGPNLRYLPGEYWDFYDHHLGLTHLSLTEALQLKGYDVEVCIPRFLPYTTQGALPTHPLFVKLYLKLPFVWRFFGKQFFVVARVRP